MKAIINPEWLALEGKPHGVLMLGPDSYKVVKVGPVPEVKDFNDITENDIPEKPLG